MLKRLKEEKEKFCTKISDFTRQFGPSNSGSVDRELTYTSRLAALLQEKDQLVSGNIKNCQQYLDQVLSPLYLLDLDADLPVTVYVVTLTKR